MDAPDWKASFRAGVSGLRQHPRLSVGLYALGLAFSLLVVLPFGLALERATAHAALPLDLREVTLTLWWSLLKATAEGLGTTGLLTLLIVPLHGLLRAVALTGIAAALRPGDLHGFWAGVGRYGWRGLLIALTFLVMALTWTGGLVFALGLLALVLPGEVAIFWTQIVLLPLLILIGLAALDLAQDYARAALVVEDAETFEAMGVGLRFPLIHRAALLLYLAWFAIALGLWLLPVFFDAALSTSVWILLVLQQFALFARTAAAVGWIGGSVQLFSDAHNRTRVGIAAQSFSAPTADPSAAFLPPA